MIFLWFLVVFCFGNAYDFVFLFLLLFVSFCCMHLYFMFTAVSYQMLFHWCSFSDPTHDPASCESSFTQQLQTVFCFWAWKPRDFNDSQHDVTQPASCISEVRERIVYFVRCVESCQRQFGMKRTYDPVNHTRSPRQWGKTPHRWQDTNRRRPSVVCGFAWTDMVHGCMVYTRLAPRLQQFHVAPAMPAL